MSKVEEFPKLLYRAAENGTEVAGVKCAFLEVADADAEKAALDDGWCSHPSEIDGPVTDPAGADDSPSVTDLLKAKDDAIETLTKERDDAQAASKTDRETAESLLKEVGELKAEVSKLAGDLKAAEELSEGETKAKDAALAELAEVKAQLAAFDKDGDGKAGGSKPRGKASADGAGE